ncbi:MAG: glycosyltransferase family 4 protein [Acidobacteria bacterium]|nr:glycosyltransferase family 4 protein [Acidobacteriota bacterium]
MKILHLISQHPESTGSGIYLQNIVRQAAIAGHRNHLVAGVSGNGPVTIAGIDEGGCHPVRFGGHNSHLDFAIPGMSDVMPYPSSRFAMLSETQLAAYERIFGETILEAARAFSPDVLHSHHLWLASSVARRLLPLLPMVTSCHSTDLRQFMQCPPLQSRVKPYCRNIDRILALSRDQAETISSLYGIAADRIDIVGSGYDDELFAFGNKAAPPPMHVLYAGKLSLSKGVDWLLRTCAALHEHQLQLHLAGSGSGEEAQECLQLAQQAGVQITVHGQIPQRELAMLMKRCHIFILPSFYEGLPLVLLEALAAGCRVITTDLPGCRELLAGADADLVRFIHLPPLASIDRPDPKDWDMLQSSMASAIIDMANRVRIAPTPSLMEVSRITRPFGWQAVFERIFASYGKAIGY